MAGIKVQIQGDASGLNAALNNASSSLNKFDRASSSVASNTNQLTKSVGNANGVAMEFNRIIQDAPFGIMGIGNNLQQLVANYQSYTQSARAAAAQTGQTVSTMSLLKGAVGSILSPVNLLTLGVAAATSAWTLYTMWSQKSAKATKEKKEEVERYIDTLTGLASAQAKGQDDAQKELTNLRLMYQATQNLAIPMEKRKKIADDLIKQYPKQFEGLTTEAVLAGNASKAYDALTKSITATAMAAAYISKVEENSRKQLDNRLKIIDKQNEANKLAVEIEKQKNSFGVMAAGSAGVGASGAAQYNTISEESKQHSNLMKEINQLGKENLEITNENALLQKNYNDQIIAGADASGSLNTSLGKVAKTTSNIKDYTDEIIKDSLNTYDAKLFDIQKKYEEIYRVTTNKDLLGLAKANEEAEKLRVNMERFLDVSKGLSQARPTVMTGSLIPQNITEHMVNSSSKIESKGLVAEDNSKLERSISRTIERGFRQGISSILGDINNLGSNFYQVFTGVFSKLAGGIQSIFNDIVSTRLGDSLKSGFENLEIGGLSNKVSQSIVAGAGIAGGLISSMFSKTSGVGQGIGGAVSGAAAGMAFGAPGAVIGGLVGLFSGIFGSSEAKRQQKIQEEQLAEQRKQTAMMERQNALGFTSSIIGQMTNLGLVTNMDRSATGELVTKISGQDLQIILQRAGGRR